MIFNARQAHWSISSDYSTNQLEYEMENRRSNAIMRAQSSENVCVCMCVGKSSI